VARHLISCNFSTRATVEPSQQYMQTPPPRAFRGSQLVCCKAASTCHTEPLKPTSRIPSTSSSRSSGGRECGSFLRWSSSLATMLNMIAMTFSSSMAGNKPFKPHFLRPTSDRNDSFENGGQIGGRRSISQADMNQEGRKKRPLNRGGRQVWNELKETGGLGTLTLHAAKTERDLIDTSGSERSLSTHFHREPVIRCEQPAVGRIWPPSRRDST